MKGINDFNPPKPRYNDICDVQVVLDYCQSFGPSSELIFKLIWDVQVVLDYCQSFGPSSELILKRLFSRLTTLLALLSGHGCKTLQALDLQNMVSSDSECEFTVTKLLKHTAQNRSHCVLKA